MKTASSLRSFRPRWTLFLRRCHCLSLAACTFNAERPGDGGTTPPTGPTPIAGLTSIRIDPANATVTLDLTQGAAHAEVRRLRHHQRPRAEDHRSRELVVRPHDRRDGRQERPRHRRHQRRHRDDHRAQRQRRRQRAPDRAADRRLHRRRRGRDAGAARQPGLEVQRHRRHVARAAAGLPQRPRAVSAQRVRRRGALPQGQQLEHAVRAALQEHDRRLHDLHALRAAGRRLPVRARAARSGATSPRPTAAPARCS